MAPFHAHLGLDPRGPSPKLRHDGDDADEAWKPGGRQGYSLAHWRGSSAEVSFMSLALAAGVLGAAVIMYVPASVALPPPLPPPPKRSAVVRFRVRGSSTATIHNAHPEHGDLGVTLARLRSAPPCSLLVGSLKADSLKLAFNNPPRPRHHVRPPSPSSTFPLAPSSTASETSSYIAIPQDPSGRIPFWPLLQHLLRQSCSSPPQLIDRLQTISANTSDASSLADDYDSLRQFLAQDGAIAEEFFGKSWPNLCDIALDLPLYLPTGKLPLFGPARPI
ncbi:hypothetical protein G7046_g1221 [Stylonectria norvegica]|nr:hypothetical protein G7046_g1221 [Stylonectria norvegica]